MALTRRASSELNSWSSPCSRPGCRWRSGPVEREPGDHQRLALAACHLNPVIAAPGLISAVADLGDDALEPDLAGLLVHLAAVDLETLAELDICVGDGFF